MAFARSVALAVLTALSVVCHGRQVLSEASFTQRGDQVVPLKTSGKVSDAATANRQARTNVKQSAHTALGHGVGVGRSASWNEGCVAVEHLSGYVLQHPRHLARVVLCSRGFCATPNHAIIVRGRPTSMKELCAPGGQWKCMENFKLVNNLKLSVNRRARVTDEITITPYDVRFPRLFIWIAQMLEDVVQLVTLAAGTGAFAAFLTLVHANMEQKD